MLKKILSPKSCAQCRLCCGFDKTDLWEIPVVSAETADYIRSNVGGDYFLFPKGKSFVFGMDFGEDGIAWCPMLTDKGCRLGDNKPFDCRVWPLRVMRLENMLAVVISPVCETTSQLSLAKLMEFVNGGMAKTIFDEAERNPDIVKDYIEGYPILAIKKIK